MHDETLTLAALDSFRKYLEAEPVCDLFLVVPELVAIECEREAERLAHIKRIVDADNALRIQVLKLRKGQELTFEQRQFLDILGAVKLVKLAPLPGLLADRDPRTEQADHMARLRKFTGQDWRGRRG